MTPLEHWTQRAREVAPNAPEKLRALAADRLANGDVTATRYGIRVALRADLSDNRGAATAYWPDKPRGCLCYAKKASGSCSHELAVRVFKAT